MSMKFGARVVVAFEKSRLVEMVANQRIGPACPLSDVPLNAARLVAARRVPPALPISCDYTRRAFPDLQNRGERLSFGAWLSPRKRVCHRHQRALPKPFPRRSMIYCPGKSWIVYRRCNWLT